MRVLVACEHSGTVREAFNAYHGVHAISCDLLPAADGRHDYHHQGDVREILNDGWDLMIAHPPCTYVCSSGMHWNTRRPERAALTEEAVEFVRLLMGARIPKWAIENPIGCLSTRIRKPDQIIQPWQFGHPESKATCLWLKNCPPPKADKCSFKTRLRAVGKPNRQRAEQARAIGGSLGTALADLSRNRGGNGGAMDHLFPESGRLMPRWILWALAALLALAAMFLFGFWFGSRVVVNV